MRGLLHCVASVSIQQAQAVMQKFGVPGASMRSGRISKLTERFSEYKSQTADCKDSGARQAVEYDPELAEVVAALCGMGQQSST